MGASAYAQIGFQVTLDTPPSFVSKFEDPVDEYSAAIVPKSYPYPSGQLKRKPEIIYSSFEDDLLRFQTQYYGRGRNRRFLVTMAVDASDLLQYRLDQASEQWLLEKSKSSLRQANQGKRGQGLGLNVALPKRLDRFFGEGGAGLKVSGYRKVTFAGRSNWTDAAETDTYKQSKFPSLRMEQISRFDITGTIGSKISVKVSQDSQTDIPLANRIQIRYKGDDDDILKVVEAGNTQLSLPNTQFVGYSSNIRGLFGIKAEAQAGNLTVTGIASQEKGSTEKSSFSPSGEETAQYIRDYQYVMRQIFDLGRPGEFAPNDSVTNLFVFETVSATATDELHLPFANFYVNPNFPDSFALTENKISGNSLRVKQLSQGDQYIFYNDPNRNRHYVVFNTPRSNYYYLGVWMVVKRQSGQVDTIGTISGETYSLKLLCLSDQDANPQQETWDLMWRNCYPIPKGAYIEDINLKVFKGLDGSEGSSSVFEFQDVNGQSVRYIEILGLDQYNTIDKQIPDNLLDERQEVFRPDWGLVIFPHRRPFDSDTSFTSESNVTTPTLEDPVPSIYDYISPTAKPENSAYYIQLSTKTRSSVIRLNRANIIEGSERITANGEILVKGTDYNIQYDFGQVTLISDRAVDPNADITIDFEYAPFFAVQKKSLFGMRAEYEWSDDLKFGSTFLYKSDKAQERKPKVGQETARTVIFDADMSLKLHPNFLTNIANAIPAYQSETPSNIAISGEVAQSHPNPNVNNAAYVDDFESALEIVSLGTTRPTWKLASTPTQVEGLNYTRGSILWHSPREAVDIRDVYSRDARAGEGTIRTLRLIYRPQPVVADTSWATPDEDSLVVDTITTASSWAGIMRYFGNRVDANRAQLFTVRARGTHGKLHFDFGRINEDVNKNEIKDSEDNPDRGDLNGAVSANEDVGIDGKPDNEEPFFHSILNPDPNRDNWWSGTEGKCPLPGGNCGSVNWDDDAFYYEYLNGTEGNISDAGLAGLPDQESFAGSSFSTVDAYFSYVIDFSTDSFRVEDSRLNDWWTYRIPIRDSSSVDQFISSGSAEPQWEQVSHVRVWFESDAAQTTTDTIEIADWGFVQLYWQDSVIYAPGSDRRTKFVVASVSEDEDTLFSPPPGVEAYEDPTTSVVEAQRALLLTFEDLTHDDTCLATKDLLAVDRYSGYRSMEMFVHGGINPLDTGKVLFFFRIGKDQSNFYEYRTKIYPGWDDRNHVDFDFDALTAVKDSAQRELETGTAVDITSGRYRVLGNPNLNEVRYFAAGVLNLDSTQMVDGTIWIDELRVTEVRKDVGTAGRVSVNGNIADLINYNFSFLSKDPYFRGLSTSTRGGSQDNLGSGQTETNYSYGLTFNLHKFFPRAWGANLPISLSYSKRITTPLLRTNSDIVLPEDVRIEEQAISESKSFSVSSGFNNKSGNPLFSLLLNRMKTRFSYRRNDQKTVKNPFVFGENYDVSTDFDLGVKKVPTLPIFFWTKPIPILNKANKSRLSLYPETWTTSARYNRNLNLTDDIYHVRTPSIKRDFTGTMRVSYKIFSNLTTTYNYDTRRDLSDLDLVRFNLKDFKLGLETRFSERFTASYDPKVLKFFTTTFGYKASYSDDWERTNASRRSSMSRSESVSGKFDHLILFGEKKGGGEERRFQGRRGGSQQGAKTEETVDRPFYDPPLAVLRFFTGWIKPIAYNYGRSYNNAVPGLVVRPNWKYRFGFEDEPDVLRVTDTRTQSSSEGYDYDFGSGFTLFGGISTDVKYRTSLSRDLIKQGARYENTSTDWPSLSIRIQKFRYFPIFKDYLNKFIEVFAPRTGFARRVKQTKDINGGFVTSETSSEDFNPLLSINFKLFRSLSLSASYNAGKDNTLNYSPSTGAIQSESNTTNSSLSLTAKYSFSSPQGISLPILGRLKFNSTVDLSATAKYNSARTETSNNAGPFRISKDNTDFSFVPVVAYTFSQQIRGGLTLRWQDTNDNYRNRKSHTREVQLWTEITF